MAMSKLSNSISGSISAAALSTTLNSTWETIVSKPYETASHHYSKGDTKLEIGPHGITSSVNNGLNALIMLETIKSLMVSKGYFTEEEFDKQYGAIKQHIEDVEIATQVANKLMEAPKTIQEDTNNFNHTAYQRYGIPALNSNGKLPVGIIAHTTV